MAEHYDGSAEAIEMREAISAHRRGQRPGIRADVVNEAHCGLGYGGVAEI